MEGIYTAHRAAAPLYLDALRAVRALYEADIRRGGMTAPYLREVRDALQGVDEAAPTPPQPTARAACQHLDVALMLARRGALEALGRALLPLAGHLAWQACPTYDPTEVGERFDRAYAYAELLGATGTVDREGVVVGILLLAPHTHYPAHAHPAAEVYHVLAGTACWRHGRSPWVRRPPGARLLHPPHTPHAMHTEAEPLLALYAWSGEVATPSHMVAPPSAHA